MTSLAEDLNTFRIFRGFPPQKKGEDESEALTIRARATLVERIPEPVEETWTEPEIDLSALAEKVCALLKQELLLERERLIRTKSW